MEWAGRDFTPNNGPEHWRRNKNVSFPGTFCGLCRSSRAIPVSDTVPKCHVPGPGAGSCCPPAVTGTGTALLPSAPHTALPMEQMCSCWGEQTQTELVQTGGRTRSLSWKYPQQRPGESRSNCKVLCFSGTAGGNGSRARRGLSPMSFAQIPCSKLPTAAACPWDSTPGSPGHPHCPRWGPSSSQVTTGCSCAW